MVKPRSLCLVLTVLLFGNAWAMSPPPSYQDSSYTRTSQPEDQRLATIFNTGANHLEKSNDPHERKLAEFARGYSRYINPPPGSGGHPRPKFAKNFSQDFKDKSKICGAAACEFAKQGQDNLAALAQEQSGAFEDAAVKMINREKKAQRL